MGIFELLFFATLGSAIIPEAVESGKLMVILIDGFRWDYFDIHGSSMTRGFPRMFKSGTRAHHMVPDFPTDSYPNYYTIMTGLYDESHGMVNNFMYDTQHKDYFLLAENPGYNQSYWWDGGEPVFITAIKQGKRAYLYYWPNCEVTIRGITPAHCIPYRSLKVGQIRPAVNEGLRAFENDLADIVVLYIGDVDSTGHRHGPYSDELVQVLSDTDDEIHHLFEELEERNLEDEVDVVIVSDHGQTEISQERVVNVEGLIDINDVEIFLEGGPNLSIWPKEGKLEKVYQALKNADPHITVYKKGEAPEHWHYRNNDRIPPLLVTAELPWMIFKPNQDYYNESVAIPSTHGYDNNQPDMWSIFLASGPSFKSDFVSDPIQNVDVYQLMCTILGIRPSPHNGTWNNVKDMLHTSATEKPVFSCRLILGFVLLYITLI